MVCRTSPGPAVLTFYHSDPVLWGRVEFLVFSMVSCSQASHLQSARQTRLVQPCLPRALVLMEQVGRRYPAPRTVQTDSLHPDAALSGCCSVVGVTARLVLDPVEVSLFAICVARAELGLRHPHPGSHHVVGLGRSFCGRQEKGSECISLRRSVLVCCFVPHARVDLPGCVSSLPQSVLVVVVHLSLLQLVP